MAVRRGRPKREGPPQPKLGRDIYVTGITMRQLRALQKVLGGPVHPMLLPHVLELAVEDFFMKHVEKHLDKLERERIINPTKEPT